MCEPGRRKYKHKPGSHILFLVLFLVLVLVLMLVLMLILVIVIVLDCNSSQTKLKTQSIINMGPTS